MVSSKQNILPLRFVQLEEKASSECISCGICVDVCPCIPISKLKNVESTEISQKVKEFLDGGPLTDIVIERAFTCSRCGICIDICPVGIDAYNLQQALRSRILARGNRHLTLNQIKIGGRTWDDFDFDDILASIQIKPNERRWIDDIPEHVQQKDTLLFLGCYTRRYVDKINVTLDVLKRLNINFITIGGGRICCGARAQAIGKLHEADKQGLKLISTLARYKPKEVLVICPACTYMIKKEIPKIIDIPFKVRHVFELMAEGLGQLHFTQAVNKTVAYHDPCKLSKMCGDYRSARELLKAIPGVKLIEMLHDKEKSNCCGGTSWRFNPNYARILRKTIMDKVKNAKVDVLATACLVCYISFCDVIGEYPYEIYDVMEVVGEGLGIKYENKLLKYRRYHNPDRVVEETKDYIKASTYSINEMRELLPTLIP
jgi:heterodisulfide reductase subunit D